MHVFAFNNDIANSFLLQRRQVTHTNVSNKEIWCTNFFFIRLVRMQFVQASVSTFKLYNDWQKLFPCSMSHYSSDIPWELCHVWKLCQDFYCRVTPVRDFLMTSFDEIALQYKQTLHCMGHRRSTQHTESACYAHSLHLVQLNCVCSPVNVLYAFDWDCHCFIKHSSLSQWSPAAMHLFN